MNELLYGVAYYDEYMPYERLQKDMEMMRAANINVIRIAESTWASEEPENGVFNFTHVERALRAAQAAGISVIVGTPTYAVPPWLALSTPKSSRSRRAGRANTAPARIWTSPRPPTASTRSA